MEKILFADRADFAITKEPGETERAKALLNELGVVIGAAEKIFAAPIAAA